MDHLLFADGEWVVKVIIALVAVAFWAISNVLRNINQPGNDQANRRQPRPTPRPQQRRAAAEPAKELEQFLEDLGVKKVKERKPTPQRPAPPTRRVEPKRTPEPAAAPQGAVRQRHLRSSIEDRHKDVIHSRLEQKHLESRVAQRSLAPDGETTVDPSLFTGALRGRRDDALTTMLSDPHLLSRAFVLGEVLGPPLAVRETLR